MHYEINVAKKEKDGYYNHLFATHKRSVTVMSELKRVYPLLKKAFPEPEYKIDVSRWDATGERLDMDKIMKEE